MRLILAIRSWWLAHRAYTDLHKANRLYRRSADRLEASGYWPLPLTPSRVPVCVRARWRN